MGELVELVLLGLDRGPVACLSGLPHTDVALGVNVAQAGDGAVRAGEICAVDDDLVAGEQAHRVAELLILLAEVAEGDVVTGGVLHAGEHALGAELGQKLPGKQLGQKLPGKLGVHADGDVVGEDRKVELLVEDAEVLLDLGKAAEGIEGTRGNQDIGAELLRTATMLEHALGLGVDYADKHGYRMIDDADRLADDLIAALVGGENDLAGGAEEEQAVDACLNHAVDVALKGSDVELAR